MLFERLSLHPPVRCTGDAKDMKYYNKGDANLEMHSLATELLVRCGLAKRLDRSRADFEWKKALESKHVSRTEGKGSRGWWFTVSARFPFDFSRVGYSTYCDYLQEHVCGGTRMKDRDGVNRWMHSAKKDSARAWAHCAVILLGMTCEGFPEYLCRKITSSMDVTDGIDEVITMGIHSGFVGAAKGPVMHYVLEGGVSWLFFPAKTRSKAAFLHLHHPMASPVSPII